MKKIAVIGGGPAALILAAHLDNKKYKVTIFEKKKAPGRKFLVAGEGGLNLTYNTSLEELINKYFPRDFMELVIRQFTNIDLINWLNKIGIPTFIGSSNRVFPDLNLKPNEVLNKILEQLSNIEVEFRLNKNWEGWNEQGKLCFEDSSIIDSDIVVFALGGASWKVTGSDGTWKEKFEEQGVMVHNFRAANCAFAVNWNEKLISAHAGKPLKNIALSYSDYSSLGELVITKFGLEGNAIYALSHKIQEGLINDRKVEIFLDLKPTMTLNQIKAKYKDSNQKKVTEILKRDLNLDRTSIGLIKQLCTKETFTNPELLTESIKSLPIVIESADNIDKAISTIGGIAINEVDENFRLKKIPNTYAIGEMLDWYAPTGGYLLQGCFGMGYVLANHLNELEDGMG